MRPLLACPIRKQLPLNVRAPKLHKPSSMRVTPQTGDVILGADTVVALNGAMIGKPADRDDAKNILMQLAGTTHTIATAQCCLDATDRTREAIAVALARVTMRAMTMDEITAYVESGESDGRAGAYAIQESGDQYVVDLQGEFDTVVGLNIAAVQRIMAEITRSASNG